MVPNKHKYFKEIIVILVPLKQNVPALIKVRLVLDRSWAILSFFKIVIIFNIASADFALISADVLLKIITILKELRIAELCS